MSVIHGGGRPKSVNQSNHNVTGQDHCESAEGRLTTKMIDYQCIDSRDVTCHVRNRLIYNRLSSDAKFRIFTTYCQSINYIPQLHGLLSDSETNKTALYLTGRLRHISRRACCNRITAIIIYTHSER